MVIKEGKDIHMYMRLGLFEGKAEEACLKVCCETTCHLSLWGEGKDSQTDKQRLKGLDACRAVVVALLQSFLSIESFSYILHLPTQIHIRFLIQLSKAIPSARL